MDNERKGENVVDTFLKSFPPSRRGEKFNVIATGVFTKKFQRLTRVEGNLAEQVLRKICARAATKNFRRFTW